MKRTIIFAIIALSLISCNRKKCWHCTSHSFERYFFFTPTWEQEYHHEGQICDKTEDEIRAYEQELTFYYVDSLEEYGATVKCE